MVNSSLNDENSIVKFQFINKTVDFILSAPGHDKVLDVLIKNGADVNVTASNDWTVLHSAVLSGKLSFSKFYQLK